MMTDEAAIKDLIETAFTLYKTDQEKRKSFLIYLMTAHLRVALARQADRLNGAGRAALQAAG